jgi:hypothetical protein
MMKVITSQNMSWRKEIFLCFTANEGRKHAEVKTQNWNEHFDEEKMLECVKRKFPGRMFKS